ncbi:efflux RND transporter periplasmic adaptor subunit [Sideroxydans lithotrophicus]|uniref:Efflux transporter, RND family, MFP subunit n=1 Tax=Sideroxydans lithotrophicus (strain ES-1) TaxID=580332 RepID=D5CTR8_SIDLE|nr:efflux RND transporter periplasmic adaptor subunit [Sideroxydans lithotrophicus]ADE12230.1 efflux transporter, RND family, MFP subunit [Sideroxydans lithotrophicus ES-1]
MKKRTNSLTAMTVLAAMFALSACDSKGGGGQAAAGNAPPPMEVDVVTVAAGSVVLTQDLPGRLEAYKSAQVRARVEGIVEKRLFTEGSDVKAGATLFRIDARNYRTAYESAKSDLSVARQTVERYKPLLEAKAVSQQDFDLAEAKLKQAEAAMSRAQLDFDNTSVPAPIAGRIGRAQVTEGALVGRGEATLLATIEQIDPIYANFTQPGTEVQRLQQLIKSGKMKPAESAKVELMLEDGSVYPHSGKLLFSNLAVDASTGSVSIRAEFPNSGHELLPGMFVRIRFPEGSVDNTILVPQRAVQMNPQGQFVMVVDAENKVAVRPVKAGDMSGENFIIEEGLKPGDQVIVNGLQKVRPGSPVKAVEWNPEGNPPADAPAVPEKK